MTAIKVVTKLSKTIEEKMTEDLIEYEKSHGIDVNYKRFSLVLSNDDNESIGVINAFTAFSEIYIDDIWVDNNFRGECYGKKLIIALENMFEDKGFNNINLCTSQFQAPEFYKKCGFKLEFIRENQYNPKLTKYFFCKPFKNKNQTQGLFKGNKEVTQTYDKISDWFSTHRNYELFEKTWLDKALSLLPKKAKILDLGCGTGKPFISYFLEREFSITGVDFSEKILTKAKNNFPEVKFIFSDMRELSLPEKFDFIICWHSFFHLSVIDQYVMFEIFAKHLNKNGVLLFTSGVQAGESWSENGGENLYHASLSFDEYKALLLTHQFNLLDYKEKDPDCYGATVWLAKK